VTERLTQLLIGTRVEAIHGTAFLGCRCVLRDAGSTSAVCTLCPNPDGAGFNKVLVTSSEGTSIQLVADMCQGHPYKTVVKESAEVVNIQLLGTGRDGDTSLARADLVEVRLPSPLSSRGVHDATAGADVPVQTFSPTASCIEMAQRKHAAVG
jgi:hypothetical protein